MVLAGIHNLTDSSIFALANTCHYLEEIYLNGCAKVSPAAVRYLVVSVPNTRRLDRRHCICELQITKPICTFLQYECNEKGFLCLLYAFYSVLKNIKVPDQSAGMCVIVLINS